MRAKPDKDILRAYTLYILDDPPETATILLRVERNVGDSLWKCRFDRLTSSLLHSFSPIHFKSRKLSSFLRHFSKQYLLYCEFSCDRNVSAFHASIWISDQRLPPRHYWESPIFLIDRSIFAIRVSIYITTSSEKSIILWLKYHKDRGIF